MFWNPLVIPGFPIKYMVVYSSEEQTSDTLSAVFQAPATSGLVTDLEPSLAYHFSVFASVTVHGNVVVGDNSSTIHFLNGKISFNCLLLNFLKSLQMTLIMGVMGVLTRQI